MGVEDKTNMHTHMQAHTQKKTIFSQPGGPTASLIDGIVCDNIHVFIQ